MPNPTEPIALDRARELSDDELIRLILDYHAAHERDLAHAAELAAQVESQHRDEPEFPRGLSAHLSGMLETLIAHQQREEAMLFPAILEREGVNSPDAKAVLSMDHERVQCDLERLVRLTRDYAAPSAASDSWRELYDLCRKYDHDFREHVMLEDRVLFARIR